MEEVSLVHFFALPLCPRILSASIYFCFAPRPPSRCSEAKENEISERLLLLFGSRVHVPQRVQSCRGDAVGNRQYSFLISADVLASLRTARRPAAPLRANNGKKCERIEGKVLTGRPERKSRRTEKNCLGNFFLSPPKPNYHMENDYRSAAPAPATRNQSPNHSARHERSGSTPSPYVTRCGSNRDKLMSSLKQIQNYSNTVLNIILISISRWKSHATAAATRRLSVLAVQFTVKEIIFVDRVRSLVRLLASPDASPCPPGVGKYFH